MMTDSVQFTGLAPQFVVPDVVKTAEYYRDKLGFEILGYFLDPPVFAMVRRGQAEIHLGKSDSGEMLFNESVRVGLGTDAYIFVNGIEALHRELLANGVEIVEGPIKRIYDCVEITIKDCNGFQLVFGE
jgi:catechol 2,3-dioxygenase-like lactoylglutathione lyase family enzyme